MLDVRHTCRYLCKDCKHLHVEKGLSGKLIPDAYYDHRLKSHYIALNMTPEEHKFRDRVIVPLQSLSEALTDPYHRNQDWSRLHGDAQSLAVSISHIPESIVERNSSWNWQTERATAENQCPEYKMIRDYGDTAKHQELRNPDREGKITAMCVYESLPDQRFQFLRVVLTLDFPDGRKIDFVECAAAAVDYWIDHKFNRFDKFSQHLPLFSKREPSKNVEIWFDPKETNNQKMILHIVKRNESGELVPTDVPMKIVWLKRYLRFTRHRSFFSKFVRFFKRWL